MNAMRVLALFAHPDDAEFLSAGTLALLAARGAKIHISTMTAGDCGSTSLSPSKITRRRKAEAGRASSLIGAAYSCLEEKDLAVFYELSSLRKVMELVRSTEADLVVTHSPVDYMVDHETTSRLAQTACFGAMAPNFRTGAPRAAKPLRAVPHLYYAAAFGGRDILGTDIPSRIFVDISATFARKAEMLACHESQRAFLRAQQDIQDPLEVQRQMAESAGRAAGVALAEGFRQHLGQGFPKENRLAQWLPGLVRVVEI
ncbi:MAG: LmbE family protein [Acidobacteria bacterium]|nr:MAG: LmbE family protein [Acidobacteriota bacterium]